MQKLVNKKIFAITPEECLDMATACVIEVEKPDWCNNYSKQSYREILLIFTTRNSYNISHCGSKSVLRTRLVPQTD